MPEILKILYTKAFVDALPAEFATIMRYGGK